MIAIAVTKRFLTVDCLFSPGKKKKNRGWVGGGAVH